MMSKHVPKTIVTIRYLYLAGDSIQSLSQSQVYSETSVYNFLGMFDRNFGLGIRRRSLQTSQKYL